MNKNDLIHTLATKNDISRNQATQFLDSLLETIANLPENTTLQIRHFGSFRFNDRAERTVALNYEQGGGVKTLPKHRQLSFKPSQGLKRY